MYLRCYFSAHLDTLTARLGALLTVIVVVRITFLSAPFTNFSTELTVLAGVLAISGHKFDADVTGINAYCTTFRTVIHAAFTGHFHQAILACYQALLTGFNTIFEFVVHKKLALVKN